MPKLTLDQNYKESLLKRKMQLLDSKEEMQNIIVANNDTIGKCEQSNQKASANIQFILGELSCIQTILSEDKTRIECPNEDE